MTRPRLVRRIGFDILPASMAATLITGPTFRALERRLLDDLTARTQANPLAPQWVLVPSATLANHLRVRLANAATNTPLAAVRVISLPRLAERLTLALLEQPTRPWHPALELILFELVARLPATSPLANLQSIGGGALLLRQAFTDLAEGGFGPAELDKLADLAREPDLSPREQAVLQLYAQWIKAITKRGVAWAPLTLQQLPDRIVDAPATTLAAVLAAESGQTAHLCVHGFYEWLDVHLQWLTALAERVPTTIYYPWQGTGAHTHPAFSFTQSVLDDLTARLGLPPGQRTHVDGDPPAAQTFFTATFPEGQLPPTPPGFLSWQPASGIRAEVVSAAVRIRRWLDDPQDPIPPEEILVVAPQAGEYADTVRDVFRAFAIPLRVSDVAAGPTPTDQPLPMLARIWEEQAPAEWVLALLRTAPGLPVAEGIDLDRFESRVRQLGIWGGTAWRTARAAGFNATEQRLIDTILEFVPADGTAAPARLTAADAGAVLDRIAADWLAEAAALEPLREAIALFAARPAFRLDRRQWTRLLAECATDKTQRDPLTRAVLFTPLMRARGLTARAVVLLGLASGQLPRRIEDDPVLSEQALGKIARVAGEIGHRVPLRAQSTEEMMLLFHLTNTAADQVHWVVPETDAAGKSVAPTPWVQRYLQRWQVDATDPFTRRVPRSPRLQAEWLRDLDPQTGRYLPPNLALALDPDLAARARVTDDEPARLDALTKRGREREWSGGIGRTPTFHRNEIGVTRIESLARCPFRFYAEKVAGWEPLEPLSLAVSLDALTRGTLLHRVLEQVVTPYCHRQPLGIIATALLAHDGAALARVAEAAIASDEPLRLALALLPAVFARAALRDTLGLASAYLESVTAETAIPVKVEQEFRRPYPGVAGLNLVGKIDRLDDLGGALRLTDYKTGRYPDGYRRSVRLGWHIQATLYPWLCQEENATFQYIFLGGGTVKAGDTEDAPAAETLLGALAPALTKGFFPPTSNQVMEQLGTEKPHPCRYCRMASACRRFERGAAPRHAKLFEEHFPERVAAILGAAS